MLDRFQVPTIGAHMAGSPEDLDRLDGLLIRHSNLFIDCSATRWIVRALSEHTMERLQKFFTQWSERVLFGSENVVEDRHIVDGSSTDLYASRY